MEIAAIEEKKPVSKWGSSNVEARANEAKIRTLLIEGWALKAIWRLLKDSGSITVSYHAFRMAVQKFGEQGKQIHDTEEGGTRMPTLRGDNEQQGKENRGAKPKEKATRKDNEETSGPITVSTGIKQFNRNN